MPEVQAGMGVGGLAGHRRFPRCMQLLRLSTAGADPDAGTAAEGV